MRVVFGLLSPKDVPVYLPISKIIIILLLLLCLLPQASRAAVIQVTNLDDSGAGSLRQAVIDAGAGDEIQFSVTGTITLTSGQILINKNLTITGPGARVLTIDGDGLGNRLFHHTGGDCIISALNLTNVSDAPCLGSNNGTIAVSNCRFEGINGLGMFVNGGNNGFSIDSCLFTNCYLSGASSGAGLFSSDNDGSITNCTFFNNRASYAGGAMALINGGTVKISHCTIIGNKSFGYVGGGGIATWGGAAIQLRNTIVAGNTDNSVYNRPNLSGTITSHDYNLIGDDTGATWNGGTQGHDTVDVTYPGVCTNLFNNGGPTDTLALLTTSPAKDNGVGTDIDGAAVNTDQRGYARPAGAGFDIGAFEGSVAVCLETQNGSRPSGGPPHKFGGGGNNPPPMAPGGQVTGLDPTSGAGLLQTRMLPLAGLGAGSGSAASIDPAGLVPGLMYQLTDPDGQTSQCWLPLSGGGSLPHGVRWTASTRFNYDVPVMDLTLDWPAEYISQMAPGRWTATYWLQTEVGICSNKRWEFLDVTPSFSSVDLDPTQYGELTFNLALSVFSEATNRVIPVTQGLVKTVIDDEAYGYQEISKGLVSVNLPFGQDSRLCFLSDQIIGQRTLDCRFENGFLRITDADNNDGPIPYYQEPDGEGYCIEYYRDLLLICNPGDPGGPIIGRLYGD